VTGLPDSNLSSRPKALTERQLRAIEKRAERPAWNWKRLTTRDVPALIAEVRRLRG
jgi:hypothetical protein